MSELNWPEITAKLPHEKGDEGKALRKELWSSIDVNDNGFVSLAEMTRGVRDVLQIPEIFDCRPAINRAFHHARKIAKTENPHGDDYLTFPEFRIFLYMLRQFFEYYQAFDRLDTGDDGRISKEEFTQDSVKATLEKWVGAIDDLEAEFDAIDVNGGGQILFNEFVDWASQKNLDIEEDDD